MIKLPVIQLISVSIYFWFYSSSRIIFNSLTSILYFCTLQYSLYTGLFSGSPNLSQLDSCIRAPQKTWGLWWYLNSCAELNSASPLYFLWHYFSLCVYTVLSGTGIEVIVQAGMAISGCLCECLCRNPSQETGYSFWLLRNARGSCALYTQRIQQLWEGCVTSALK